MRMTAHIMYISINSIDFFFIFVIVLSILSVWAHNFISIVRMMHLREVVLPTMA
jgi:hypothetical protein